MLVIGLSCFCTLLFLITCISLHIYVCGEQEVSDLKNYILNLENEYKKLNKILTCKCCGQQYNFNKRYDFNFCCEKCDEECEL